MCACPSACASRTDAISARLGGTAVTAADSADFAKGKPARWTLGRCSPWHRTEEHQFTSGKQPVLFLRSAAPCLPTQPRSLHGLASKPPSPSSSPPPSHTACSSSLDAPTARRTAAGRRVVADQGPSTSGPSDSSFAAETRTPAALPACSDRASRTMAASEPDEP